MAWWKHKTKTARLVYDRPRSPFKWRDLVRISPRIDLDFEIDSWFLILVIDLLQRFREKATYGLDEAVALQSILMGAVPSDEEFTGFGGGEFGGGGATRRYDESVFERGPCGYMWLVMPIQNCDPATGQPWE